MGSLVKSYKDLIVWQKSHKLAMTVYKISQGNKKNFADLEIWKQAMRSVFSVPANIVEGYYSHKGKSFASYLEISRGSAGEAQYWIIVLIETSQIDAVTGYALMKEYDEVIAMLTGLVRKVRS